MNMKNIFSNTVILLLAGIASVYAEFNNPVLDKHADDVTFYVNFDETPNAVLSAGEGTPFRSTGTPDFVPGVSGKALRRGMLHYRGGENADLAASGTLIYLVAPEATMTEKPENGKEPGFLAVAMTGGEGSYTLFSGKMGGQPWGKAPLNSYVQYAHGSKIPHVNCVIDERLKAETWKPGEWQMIAVTWKPGSFAASLNGGNMQYSALQAPMTGTCGEIRLGFGKAEIPAQVILDEVVILNKELTQQQLKEIYDLFKKQLPEK